MRPKEKEQGEKTNRERAQIRQEMRTEWDREVDEEQEGTVSESNRGKGIGFVMTASSPMAGKMCVHMLQ